MHNQKKKKNELTTEEKGELKCLMWIASKTKLDINYKTCAIRNAGKHITVKMLHESNKAMTKLKSKKAALRLPDLGNAKNTNILLMLHRPVLKTGLPIMVLLFLSKLTRKWHKSVGNQNFG